MVHSVCCFLFGTPSAGTLSCSVFETEFGEVTSAQLHHFTDASEDGYGGETYLLQQNLHSYLHVTFVMGKSRVFLCHCLNTSLSDDPEAKVSVATPSPEVLGATSRLSNHFFLLAEFEKMAGRDLKDKQLALQEFSYSTEDVDSFVDVLQ